MPKFEVTLQIFIRFPETHRAFSFKEYFSKTHEIFFWKMFIKSVVFSLNFFSQEIHGIFVFWKQNYFSKIPLNFSPLFVFLFWRELFTSLKINFLIQNKLFFFKITMEFPLFWNERIFVWVWQQILS